MFAIITVKISICFFVQWKKKPWNIKIRRQKFYKGEQCYYIFLHNSIEHFKIKNQCPIMPSQQNKRSRRLRKQNNSSNIRNITFTLFLSNFLGLLWEISGLIWGVYGKSPPKE